MNPQEELDLQNDIDKVQQATHRRVLMKSFGRNTIGLLANTKFGPMVVDPEDAYVSLALLHNGCYSENELELAKQFVTKGGNVLIVGAHIGAFVVPLSRECKKIYAIEANPSTFKHLVSNLRLNDCANASAYYFAASDKEETIKFLMSRENSGGSKRLPHVDKHMYLYDSPHEIEITAIPVEAVIKERNFDLVLMDIEGSEYFALKGMQEILKGTKAISVEFAPDHIRDVANVTIDQFLDAIEPRFDWLFIPGNEYGKHLFNKENIRKYVKDMFDKGTNHEGIYFLKNPLPDFLKNNQLTN